MQYFYDMLLNNWLLHLSTYRSILHKGLRTSLLIAK